MNPSRRHVLTGIGALGIGAALAACGSGSGGGATAGTSADGSQSAGAGAFPVSVPHKYGTTTVKAAPKRVVCVGLMEQDILLALDIVPVAVTSWLEAAKGEIYPWAVGKLGGAKLPTVLDGQKFSVEAVAAQRPDLIVAIYSGITRTQYDQLSKLAPTIGPAKGYVDYGTPWDVQTTMVSAAVGKKAQGAALVRDVRAKITAAKSAHPQFAGKTAAVVTPYEGIYIYGPQDQRSVLQEQLGFVFPQKFHDIGGKSFGGSISAERAKEIDFDVVVWLASESDVKSKTGGLYEQTTAAKQGRTIYVPSSISNSKKNSTYASAFTMVTPLSLPWLLERYVPQLAAAVDGKAATKVPAVSE